MSLPPFQNIGHNIMAYAKTADEAVDDMFATAAMWMASADGDVPYFRDVTDTDGLLASLDDIVAATYAAKAADDPVLVSEIIRRYGLQKWASQILHYAHNRFKLGAKPRP